VGLLGLLVATALLVGVTSSHGSDGGLSPGSLLVMIECRFSLSSAGTGFVRLSLVYTPGELLDVGVMKKPDDMLGWLGLARGPRRRGPRPTQARAVAILRTAQVRAGVKCSEFDAKAKRRQGSLSKGHA
jgi:hypothetical protein